jgi:thioredoxin reductase (NADPH)
LRAAGGPFAFLAAEPLTEPVFVEKEYGGASRVRGRYKPGDFYGEAPILLDAPTIASLRATEPSRLVRLDRNQFKELIDSSAECANLVVMARSFW